MPDIRSGGGGDYLAYMELNMCRDDVRTLAEPLRACADFCEDGSVDADRLAENAMHLLRCAQAMTRDREVKHNLDNAETQIALSMCRLINDQDAQRQAANLGDEAYWTERHRMDQAMRNIGSLGEAAQ